MMHPDTELRYVSEEVGVGVFATKFIPKGTIVWIEDDLDIILDEDEVESLDELRREMVYKYSYQNNDGQYILNWDHSRYMNHSFQYYQEWDEMAREAFKYFNKVEQPLKHLIKEEFVDKVNAVASGREPLDSILTTFEDESDESDQSDQDFSLSEKLNILDKQKLTISILGSAGGVAKSTLAILDKSFQDVNDPIHPFIRCCNIHLIDKKQKSMEYYGPLIPHLTYLRQKSPTSKRSESGR